MSRILAIDDELIYHKMVARALEPQGYQIETASNGLTGLKKARQIKPDLIITDVMMPDITGYEVTQRLRRDPQFAHIPILILTSQTELEDKLKSFESGADDHMTKPFDSAELVARVGVLLRRFETIKSAQSATRSRTGDARLIAIHSLRGGIGCSTFAVNLALGFYGIWGQPTLLLDLALLAGQVALMLNAPLKRTWADLATFQPEELDLEILQSIISTDERGLQFIAAPTFPTEAEKLSPLMLHEALKLISHHFDYAVADLPHDFSETSLQAMDNADMILMLISPELASIRAAVAALQTYRELGYDKSKIKIVLNNTFARGGISRDKIEKAISAPVSMTIPFAAGKFIEAINLGQPLLAGQPGSPAAALIEDFAFYLSKNNHKKVKPVIPTQAWKRVYKRYSSRRKTRS